MKNYFGILNSADDHLLREAISANNYGFDIVDIWLGLDESGFAYSH